MKYLVLMLLTSVALADPVVDEWYHDAYSEEAEPVVTEEVTKPSYMDIYKDTIFEI